MTTKELSEVAGVSVDTVLRRAKEIYPARFGQGKRVVFTKDEAIRIMGDLRKKGFVELLQNEVQLPQNAEVSHLGAMVANLAVMMQETMKVMVTQQNQISAMLAGNHSTPERKTLPAPQLDPRAHIIKLANEYVSKTGIEHRDAYTMLYREFGYRTHCNAIVSAKNRGMKIIDYIDSEGQIETLEAIALEAFAS